MNRSSQITFAVLALAFAVAGCGRALPTAPDTREASPAAAVRAPAASVASTPTATPNTLRGTLRGVIGEIEDVLHGTVAFVVDPSRRPLPGPLVYLPSILQLVLPGLDTNVHAGRWSLDFHPGSLNVPRAVSISQASDGTMRVEFGPDGLQFGRDVDLTIDYTGTSLDPSSPSYVAGSQPVFLYFDPARQSWVEMPSTNDVAHRKLTAKLQHFSRYGCGTRAGW